MEVQSELYEEDNFKKVQVLENSNYLLSLSFTKNLYSTDNKIISVDEDGDLVPPRKKSKVVKLEFSKSTAIPLVGLQIWRGAFLLADFILSKHQSYFKNKIVLELAAGVRFTSIIAGIVSKKIIATDIATGGILDIIGRNMKRNEGLIEASTSIVPLNFYQDEWSPELKRIIEETDVIIAADVIYDNQLSEAFVDCLTKIMKIPPRKTVFLALEKRYVFTLKDLDTVAPCYDHFMKYLHQVWSRHPMCSWTVERITLDFQKQFDYERTEHLVLWKFSS